MAVIIPKTTKQWTVQGFEGPSSLKYTEVPISPLGDNEVLIQSKSSHYMVQRWNITANNQLTRLFLYHLVHGASLNPRDLLITRGEYPWPVRAGIIPGSDGAGIVLATGPSVTRFKAGDRVVTMLNQKHISGSLTTETATNYGTGASLDGTFREVGAFDEDALVAMPGNLGFVEASTLSCAGVTAWNALFGGARPIGQFGEAKGERKGKWVLTQGTGAVSLFALQFAKSSGAHVIATTGSDSKIPLLKTLGVDHVLNYHTTPHWGAAAKKLTPGGVGVDLVIEVAGPTTLRQSAEALKLDGQISVVGFIGGNPDPVEEGGGNKPAVPSVLETWLNLYTARGIWVGSQEQMEEMCRAVEENAIRPVLDERAFGLEELREAYEYLEQGGNMGKIGIEIWHE
ncbi:hypothetical protein BJY01DRAFT_159802 [Aspergillus pseudoustus]|uniref:Enoyl reductase (ER) domain-containing protein n=1 Tax=Aspergillus pseudoustus TaxID=1810923 RepID=A0ABR4KAN4_9EURO